MVLNTVPESGELDIYSTRESIRDNAKISGENHKALTNRPWLN
jgi:hypothetical protein